MKVEIIIPRKAGSKAFYKLLEPIVYLGVVIPSGFVTDGASVPRLLHPLFPPIDSWLLGAVLHDYLLVTGMDRRMADDKLAEALIDLDVPTWRQKLIMAGVRAYSATKRKAN